MHLAKCNATYAAAGSSARMGVRSKFCSSICRWSIPRTNRLIFISLIRTNVRNQFTMGASERMRKVPIEEPEAADYNPRKTSNSMRSRLRQLLEEYGL